MKKVDALFRRKKGNATGEDPYQKSWTGIQVAQVFEQTGAGELYHGYGLMSEWHHWDASGVASLLEVGPNRTEFRSSNLDRVAMAYAIAFQALYETIRLLDPVLELGQADRLAAFIKAYNEELKSDPVLRHPVPGESNPEPA